MDANDDGCRVIRVVSKDGQLTVTRGEYAISRGWIVKNLEFKSDPDSRTIHDKQMKSNVQLTITWTMDWSEAAYDIRMDAGQLIVIHK